MHKRMPRAFVLVPILLVGLFFCFAQKISAQETPWYYNGDYVVIDTDTTWSGNVSYPDKPVLVTEWATLTIEAGTHVEINKLMVYLYGKVVAIGTKESNIHFTKPAFDPAGLSVEQKQYDPKCFMKTEGMIEFDTNMIWDDEPPSIFSYVQFDGMGNYLQYDSLNCPAESVQGFFKFPAIINTAFASTVKTQNPALLYKSGRLRIENSTFINNAFEDVGIDVSRDFSGSYNYYDFLQIENSNFEKAGTNLAAGPRGRSSRPPAISASRSSTARL